MQYNQFMPTKALPMILLTLLQFIIAFIASVLLQVTFIDYTVVLPVFILMAILVLVIGFFVYKRSQSRVLKGVTICLMIIAGLQLPDSICRRLVYTITNPRPSGQVKSVAEQERLFLLKQRELEEALKQKISKTK